MKRWTTVDDSFMVRGDCRHAGVDMFPTTTTGEARAKSICARCPVVDACLDYAMACHIDDGVWGGTTEVERRRLRRRRNAELRIVA